MFTLATLGGFARFGGLGHLWRARALLPGRCRHGIHHAPM